MPEELKRRSDRLKVIEAAQARIEERARQADKADGRFVDEEGVTRSMCGRRVKRPYGQAVAEAQDNFTDPDSRIMPTASGGFEQCYNGQAAVDEGSQLIVGADLTNSCSEAAMLLPMVEQVQSNTELEPKMVLADTNYDSEKGFRALEERAVQACVALGGEDKQRAIKSDLLATQRCLSGCAAPQERRIIGGAKPSRSRCSAGSSRCWGSEPSAYADSALSLQNGA